MVQYFPLRPLFHLLSLPSWQQPRPIDIACLANVSPPPLRHIPRVPLSFPHDPSNPRHKHAALNLCLHLLRHLHQQISMSSARFKRFDLQNVRPFPRDAHRSSIRQSIGISCRDYRLYDAARAEPQLVQQLRDIKPCHLASTSSDQNSSEAEWTKSYRS